MPEATDRMEGLAGGFFISRVLSPGAMAAAASRPRRARRAFSAEDGKENIAILRMGRHRKSPLPTWYPRTPLRDITALVDALERRRARMRTARAQETNVSPEVVPPPPETPDPPPAPDCLTPTTSTPMQADPTADSGSKSVEHDQMLCGSIEKIEKAVEQYLSRNPSKEPQKRTTTATQRTLMSMR